MAHDDLDLRRALQNPRATFGIPERVLADPRLDREGKRAILRSWEQDERDLAVAEEEGMGGGEHAMLQRVLQALDAVSKGTPEESATLTKHGARSLLPEDDAEVEPVRALVREIMHTVTEVVHLDQDLHEAAIRLRDQRTAFLPVVDGDEIVGVLTAQHTLETPRASGEDSHVARVRDHLSKEIAYCYDSDDLTTCRRAMERTGHRRLLVVDREKNLVGLVSLDQLSAVPGHRRSREELHNDPERSSRIASAPGRARGDEPGGPWTYSVKPRLKK